MQTIRTCLAAMLGLGIGVADAQTLDGAATAAPTTTEAETDGGAGLVRRTSLQDLGYREGLSFRQLSGGATIYFPVPDDAPIGSARLILDLRQGATTDTERYLQVSVGSRVIAARALNGVQDSVTLEVPIDPDDVEGGFLPVGLTYSGAHSERVCVDERASGDFLTVGTGSTLELTLDPDAITSPELFAGLRPPQIRVRVPDEDSLAGLAAAARAAALFGAEEGRVRFGPTEETSEGDAWTTGTIALDISATGPASTLSVAAEDGRPVLTAAGTDPQVGLYQLSTLWAGLAGVAEVATQGIGTGTRDTDGIALSSLDADLGERGVTASETVQVPFQSSDLPTGTSVSSVDLVLAAALDPEGRGATAVVFLNDTLLGSRPLASGEPERMTFAVPDGLVARDNLLRIAIQRQPTGGECRFLPQSYPAQVLPGSRLVLAPSDDPVDEFFELRQGLSDGAQLVVDPETGLAQSDVLPWLAGVVGTLVPDRAEIVPRASLSAIEAGTPFIAVSATNPGDGEALIRMDQGRVEIRDNEGNLMFDGEALSRLGIVQIVSRGGTPGLWLRPGDGPAPVLSASSPLVLDRGNLALLDETGLLVATSTTRSTLVDVVYPDQPSLMQILDKYRPWIVGGLWIILTLVVLAVFQRIYRSRRAPPNGGA